MPTRRQQRVNGRIVEEVSAAIRGLKDPRIGFVTVTGAEVSPDLRHAKVFVSVLGDDAVRDETLAALKHSAGHIHHQIGDALNMKYTPHLEFCYDESIARADAMSRLIQAARASDPDPLPHEDGAEELPPPPDGNDD